MAAAPERLARLHAKNLPLRLRALPVVFPEFEFAMLWHQRRQSDEGLKWLREQIRAEAAVASTRA